MRPAPKCKLNPKVKTVWRITAVVAWVWFLVAAALFQAMAVGLDEPSLTYILAVPCAIAGVALILVFAVIAPPIRYVRWSYEVGEHELDIMRGIIWRKRFMIPFIRVQNTDTKQGPIMRACGLASVTVSTAAGEHEIPGLTAEEADALRDNIATQARLAREDL